MLADLHVRNYVLINSLDVSFPEGLIIITGETGAGKSILLGALSLVLGAKADASVIGKGAESCVVEAEFSYSSESGIDAILEEGGIDPLGDGHIIIRRVVAASGRSRAFVNDCPANLNILSALSSRLMDVHSQHRNLLLSDMKYRTESLDLYCGATSLTAECGSLWRSLSSVRRELSEIKEKIAELKKSRDYNQSSYDKIDSAHLSEGELEELEEEHRMLSNAELIKSSLAGAEAHLSGGEERSLSAAIKESAKCLQKVSSYVEAARSLSERLESSRCELEDILSEISSLYEGMDVSEQRLIAVEERMSLIYSLLKRFDCETVAELIDLKNELSSKLEDSDNLETLVDKLQKEETELVEKYRETALKLHKMREEGAAKLSADVSKSLKSLELDDSEFVARATLTTEGPNGLDDVEFLIASNGREASDVGKTASGGELSRIMLSIKSVLSRHIYLPVLFFDEIDTGVSGSAADRMGSMICSMGKYMQVFSITHLPQVAAKGDAHFLVSKENGVSTLNKIEGDDRVREIARMLSGTTVTSAAISNALELLYN